MRRLVFAFLLACSPHASEHTTAPGPPSPLDAPPGPAPSASAGSPGCAKAARAGVRARQPIMAAGKTRSYTLVVPEGYAPERPYPLVFALHGHGGTAAGVRAQMDLERHAKGAAVFVYPHGASGGWDLDAPSERNRDVALFDAILLELHGSLCLDPRRVFVTGFSNGAYMANQLACRRGDRIRAIATHAGGGPYENAGTYDDQGHLVCPGKAVAALVVHGLADKGVAPSEGQKSVDHWSFANRCSGGSSPSGPASCVSLNGCVQPVVACKVPGLGHGVWPEGKRLTWSFFDALR